VFCSNYVSTSCVHTKHSEDCYAPNSLHSLFADYTNGIGDDVEENYNTNVDVKVHHKLFSLLYYVSVYTIHGMDTPYVSFLITCFGLMGPSSGIQAYPGVTSR
jgi:hypothetical protein